MLGHLCRQPLAQPLEACVIHRSTLPNPTPRRKTCYGEELRKSGYLAPFTVVTIRLPGISGGYDSVDLQPVGGAVVG